MTFRSAVARLILRAAAWALMPAFALGQPERIHDAKLQTELGRLRALVQTQGFEKTEQELWQSLRKKTADFSAIESLGLLYVESKKPEQVASMIPQIPLREEDRVARVARILANGGYLEQANQFLLAFVRRSQAESWKLTDVRAALLIESGRHEEAIQILTAASSTPEQEAMRSYRLALANQGLQRWVEALSHIRQARVLRPDPLFSYTEGLLLLAMDRLPEAEQVLSEGRKRFPSSAQLCLGQARLSSRVGDFYKAEGALKKAIELYTRT